MNFRGRPTEIQITCLESRAEMRAFDSEIEQLLEEGGVLHPSWGPKKIVANGKVNGIKLVRCTRVFDESRRFNPSFDPSVTTVLKADTVILAIGQSTDLSFFAEADRLLITERGTIRRAWLRRIHGFARSETLSQVRAPSADRCARAAAGAVVGIRSRACRDRVRVGGVFQLLDESKQVLRIAGTPDLRQALAEQLSSNPKTRYFIYEEALMYTQRESELLQHVLQEHGRLPAGNDLGDDLF